MGIENEREAAPIEVIHLCAETEDCACGRVDEDGRVCGGACDYCDERAVPGRECCKACIAGFAVEDILERVFEDGGADQGAALISGVIGDWVDQLRTAGVQVDDLDVQSITVALAQIGAAASSSTGRRS